MDVLARFAWGENGPETEFALHGSHSEESIINLTEFLCILHVSAFVGKILG